MLFSLLGLFLCSPRNLNMLIFSPLYKEPPAEEGVSRLKFLSYLAINTGLILCTAQAEKGYLLFFKLSCLKNCSYVGAHSYSKVRILVPEPSI